MQPQDQQPLLGGGPDTSSWHSAPIAIAAASAAPSSAYPHPFSNGAQQPSTRAYPDLSHNPLLQQHQPGCYNGPPPPPAERYPSYGSSLQSRTISGAEACSSSFDSLSLSSSWTRGRPVQRYGSCASTDTADGLPQRYPSCNSMDGAGAPALGSSQLGATQPGPVSAGGRYPVLGPQAQQQQRTVLRYPSLDTGGSTSSSGGVCRAPSIPWGAAASLNTNRTNSVSSTCSSGRYPTLPGPSDALASRVESAAAASAAGAAAAAAGGGAGVVADGQATQPRSLLDSWESDAIPVQQQQQQWPVLPKRPRRCPEGLYPVLSGEEAGPQAQQQQQQQACADQVQAAPWGFDLQVHLQRLSGLPAVAHPYVMVLMQLGSHEQRYRTEPQWSTQQAVYGQDDSFDLVNIPAGCILRFEVWDKSLSEDAMIGRATWSLAAHLQAAGGGAEASADTQDRDQEASWVVASASLELKHPTKSTKSVGQLQFKVLYRPAQQEQPPSMVGPVRFRQHLCPTVGVFTGHWSTEETMCYSTYKLYLCHIPRLFEGVRMHWNPDYDKARMIFQPVLGMTPVVQVLKQQHSAMYATQAGTSRGGVLRCAGDLFRLFNNGIRDGQPRFFTYVLCSDCFRCSETGTNFGIDIVSKHAMHAGGAEEVLYAGEFCIMRCAHAADGQKLVLDNNSGTYSPHKSKLGLLRQLFELNFPGMTVEVLDWRDPKLSYYQSLCPSRAAAPAATVAPAASTLQGVRQPGQFAAG